nr:solute carrier family 2, facilitated glucose transporter member 5 isoform X5 [Kogia breviceps]
MEQQDAVKREGRLTPVLALATLIAAFGSSFQYGYNVAVINSPAKPMKAFYNETYYDRISEYISEFSLTLLWSLSVSMFPFGGFLGSLMVGPLVNKLGRKGTLLFNNVFSIVPAILMGCSEVARSFEMIIVARLLVGICAGLSSNVVPMYLGELAPRNLRGALGVVPQLFITVGILAAQILGLRSLLANEAGWPTLLGVTGVPAALQLLLLPFFPESPRYLLIQKKDEAAAKNALRGLRGWDDVDAETQEIWEEDKAEKAAGFISVLKLLRMRSLRWQVISIVVLMGGQQLSGVNAVPGRPGPGAGRPPPRGPGRPAGLTSPGGGLPDLLLRRPDLPERWGESTGCPVCDGGHRRGQRADDRLRRFRGGAPGEESPAPPRLLHLLRRLLRADGRPGSAGHNILDALRQHRVHHLLCHRTCPWAQPYPRTAHHRDRPAVLPAGRLHGRGQCPLALQLHCGLDLPIHPSGPRSLQLYRFCRDMSSHHHLHLPGCPRDQVQDLHRNQSDLHQDEQSVRAAPRKGGAKGLSALYCGAVTLEEEPVNQVDPSPAPRHMPGSCPSTVLGQPLCGSWQHRLL